MKNAEGYFDPVMTEAFRGIQMADALPQPGEIWTNNTGVENLVIKSRPGCCVVLKLNSVEGEGCIKVMSKTPRYCRTDMPTILTVKSYGEYVKTINNAEFTRIKEDMMQSMFGVKLDGSAEIALREECSRLRAEVDKLTQEVERQKTMKADLKQELEMERKKPHDGGIYEKLYNDLLDRVMGGKR